ncbi:MAG: GNAT family N-acetyltransferase, partial [Pontixanthobacter sp.]
DLALPLSERTYQARSLDAGLPVGSAAHDERRDLAAQNRVRAFLLCVDGRAISYLYLPIDGDTVTYAYLGYDPDFARFSPGTVLQLEALERLFAENRYRHFDFTEGDGGHKAMFGTHSVECASFFLLNRNLAHHLLLRGVDLFDATVARTKGWVENSSKLPAIRRMSRAR